MEPNQDQLALSNTSHSSGWSGEVRWGSKNTDSPRQVLAPTTSAFANKGLQNPTYFFLNGCYISAGMSKCAFLKQKIIHPALLLVQINQRPS